MLAVLAALVPRVHLRPASPAPVRPELLVTLRPGGRTADARRAPLARGCRIDPPGFDGGKKIKGKKRHILVDTQGLLMDAIVHAADMQDRDGGVLLMATLFGMYPFLLKLYSDAGYQGPKSQRDLARVCREVNVEIARRCDTGKFVVLPKRWIVERHHCLVEPLPRAEQGLGVP